MSLTVSLFQECRLTFKLALPIIIGMLAQMAMGLIDSAMVGRLGAVHLAAGAFANGLLTVLMVFGIGASNVIGPILSQFHGAEKEEHCGGKLLQATVLFTLMGLALSIMAEVLSYFLDLFDQPKEVTEIARNFFRLMGFSLPTVLVFNCYKQFVESFGKTGFPMILNIFGLVVNTGINYFLIYGNGPFPKMGLLGAGIGTFVARTLMLLAIIYHVHKRSRFKRALTTFRWEKVDLKSLLKILRVGAPSGTQVLFEISAFVMASIMMGWLGTVSLAAHQIAIGIASMTFMCALGVSLAGGLRVGAAKGKGDMLAVRQAGKAALLVITMIMSFLGIIMLLFRRVIPLIYVNDPEVITLATQLILIAVMFQVFDGLQAVGIGLLRGLLDLRVPTLITVFAYGFVCLPLAYGLGFPLGYGALGIWSGLLGGLVVASALLVWRFIVVTKRA